MRILLDENLPRRWIEFLGKSCAAAIHCTDAGLAGAPDNVLLDHAQDAGLVLVTQDLDFTRILALRGSRLPSVIQLRVHKPLPEVIGDALLQTLDQYRMQLENGCLKSLDLDQRRIRLLPIR